MQCILLQWQTFDNEIFNIKKDLNNNGYSDQGTRQEYLQEELFYYISSSAYIRGTAKEIRLLY